MFTKDAEVLAVISNSINAPFVEVTYSELGGAHRATLHFRISYDERSTWSNGIFHNSRYFFLTLELNGTLMEHMRSHRGTKRLRQCNVKNVDDAIARINKHLEATK